MRKLTSKLFRAFVNNQDMYLGKTRIKVATRSDGRIVTTMLLKDEAIARKTATHRLDACPVVEIRVGHRLNSLDPLIRERLIPFTSLEVRGGLLYLLETSTRVGPEWVRVSNSRVVNY